MDFLSTSVTKFSEKNLFSPSLRSSVDTGILFSSITQPSFISCSEINLLVSPSLISSNVFSESHPSSRGVKEEFVTGNESFGKGDVRYSYVMLFNILLTEMNDGWLLILSSL